MLRCVVNVTDPFVLTTYELLMFWIVSLIGVVYERDHMSEVRLPDAPLAYHRIMSVFVIVGPKPIENQWLFGTVVMKVNWFIVEFKLIVINVFANL